MLYISLVIAVLVIQAITVYSVGGLLWTHYEYKNRDLRKVQGMQIVGVQRSDVMLRVFLLEDGKEVELRYKYYLKQDAAYLWTEDEVRVVTVERRKVEKMIDNWLRTEAGISAQLVNLKINE